MKYSRKRPLIAEEESNQGERTSLFSGTDKERMVLNPGKSLKSSSKDLPRYYTVSLIYSFIGFVLAYTLTYFPGKIASALLATVSGRGPVIFHHKILFMNVTGWERSDAVSIFAAPLVVNFIQTLVYGGLFHILKTWSGPWRFLGFWLMGLSFIRFAGCVVPGLVSGEEFGYLAGWLYLNSAFVFVAFLFSIVLILVGSGIFAKWILETAFAKHMILKSHRWTYLLYTVGLASVLGLFWIALVQVVNWNRLASGRFELSSPWDSMHELTLLSQCLLLWGGMSAFLLLYRQVEIIPARDLRMQNVQAPVVVIFLLLPLVIRIWLGQGWYW